jgi:hypothetical protein
MSVEFYAENYYQDVNNNKKAKGVLNCRLAVYAGGSRRDGTFFINTVFFNQRIARDQNVYK